MGKGAEGNPSPNPSGAWGSEQPKESEQKQTKEETQQAQRHYSVCSRSANLEGAMGKQKKKLTPNAQGSGCPF